MRELLLTPEAFDDIRTARRWYEGRRAGLGSSFQLALEATLSRLQRMPGAHPEVAAPFRRALVRRYPYEIFYEFDEHRVLVLMVFHTSRDPQAALARLRGQH